MLRIRVHSIILLVLYLPLSAQSLGSSPLSPSSLTSQLPILAALGLSALSNLRHFSSDQLALLGINPGHLGGGGGWKMVGNGRGSSGFHGHRGELVAHVHLYLLTPSIAHTYI